jgi:hypothetical protein
MMKTDHSSPMIDAESGTGRGSGLGARQLSVLGAAQAPAVAGHDVDVGAIAQDRQLFGEERRLPQVVAVEEREELAARGAERRVTGAGQAAIGLLQELDAGVLARQRLDRLRRSIPRPVVDDDQLEVGPGLRERDRMASPDVRLDVVRGHDDAHGRHVRLLGDGCRRRVELDRFVEMAHAPRGGAAWPIEEIAATARRVSASASGDARPRSTARTVSRPRSPIRTPRQEADVVRVDVGFANQLGDGGCGQSADRARGTRSRPSCGR